MSDLKTKIVIEGEDKSKKATSSAKKNVDSLSKSATKSADAADKSSTRIKKSNTAIAASYGLAAKAANVAKLAIFGIFAAIGGSVAGLARSNAEYEKLSASLETVTGSAENAESAFNLIEEFSKSTPFKLTEVVDAFIKLKSLGLDPSEEALKSYGNTASAMSKSLNQFIEAVADASTSEFERLKEFGIKAKQQGDKVSFTFQGVTTTIGNNAKEIEGYLRDIGNIQFAGAMERQMQTIGGFFSNFGDQIGAISRTIGESGFNESIKTAFGGINEFLADIVGGVKGSASEIGVFFQVFSNAVLLSANVVKASFNVIQIAIKTGVALVIPPLELLTRALAAITVGDASEAFRLMSEDIRKYSRELVSGIGEDFNDIGDAGRNMADVFLPVENSIKQVTKANKESKSAIDANTESTVKATEAAKKLAEEQEKQNKTIKQRIFDETRTDLEKLAIKQKEYEKLLESGVIDQELFNRAMLKTKEIASQGFGLENQDLSLSEQAAQRALKWEQEKLEIKRKQAELDAKNPFNVDNTANFEALLDKGDIDQETFNDLTVNVKAELKLPSNEEIKAELEGVEPIVDVFMRPDVKEALDSINKTIAQAQSQVKTIVIPVVYEQQNSLTDGSFSNELQREVIKRGRNR